MSNLDKLARDFLRQHGESDPLNDGSQDPAFVNWTPGRILREQIACSRSNDPRCLPIDPFEDDPVELDRLNFEREFKSSEVDPFHGYTRVNQDSFPFEEYLDPKQVKMLKDAEDARRFKKTETERALERLMNRAFPTRDI